MAFLNAMKAKMAGIQQMAEVAASQAMIADNVAQRMASIEALMKEPSANSAAPPASVLAWLSTGAGLSGPCRPA